jgi:hypothetical protein
MLMNSSFLCFLHDGCILTPLCTDVIVIASFGFSDGPMITWAHARCVIVCNDGFPCLMLGLELM